MAGVLYDDLELKRGPLDDVQNPRSAIGIVGPGRGGFVSFHHGDRCYPLTEPPSAGRVGRRLGRVLVLDAGGGAEHDEYEAAGGSGSGSLADPEARIGHLDARHDRFAELVFRGASGGVSLQPVALDEVLTGLAG